MICDAKYHPNTRQQPAARLKKLMQHHLYNRADDVTKYTAFCVVPLLIRTELATQAAKLHDNSNNKKDAKLQELTMITTIFPQTGGCTQRTNTRAQR